MIRRPLRHDDRGFVSLALIAVNFGVTQHVVRQWAKRSAAERRYDTAGRVHYRFEDIRRYLSDRAA